MKRQTGTFKAQDVNGRSYTILIFTDFLDASSMDGPAEIEGLKELRTATGEAVNWIAKGSYLVVGPGIPLTSTDPTAP